MTLQMRGRGAIKWGPDAIRELLTTSGLTIEQLAHRIGVTSTTAWRWKDGRTKPSPMACDRLDQIAEATK